MQMVSVVVKKMLLKQRALLVHVCNQWQWKTLPGISRIHFVAQLLLQQTLKIVLAIALHVVLLRVGRNAPLRVQRQVGTEKPLNHKRQERCSIGVAGGAQNAQNGLV
ncbi:MAG: hypothetical protein IH617_19605 [Hydrogenophaga sp.]|nr:hypothetical protein [Hydrogenophaga sp.]